MININKSNITTIIESVIQSITEDFSLYNSQQKQDIYKNIFISFEYFSKLINNILNYKGTITNLFANLTHLRDPNSKGLSFLKDIENIPSLNHKIDFIKGVYKDINEIIDQFLQYKGNINDQQFIKEKLKEFKKNLFGQRDNLKDAILYSRSLLNEPIEKYQNKNLSDIKGTEPEEKYKYSAILSELESYGFKYLNSVESLIRKILSIGDLIQYSKIPLKDEPFFSHKKQLDDFIKNRKKSRNQLLSTKQRRLLKNIKNRRKFHNSIYDIDDIGNYLDKYVPSPESKVTGGTFNELNSFPFDKEKFLKYFKTYLRTDLKNVSDVYSNDELNYALSICKNINTIEDIHDEFKEFLKNLFNKLTNKKSIVIFKNEAEFIINLIKNIHKMYQHYMSGFINILENKEENFEIYFKNNIKIMELFLKFIEFQKIDLKKTFLEAITGKKSEIDAAQMAQEYSEENKQKIYKRLYYWSLFRKLGWVKEKTPDWLYKID